MSLCGKVFPHGGYYCTRETGHVGEHVAAIGPYRPGAPIIVRWEVHGSDSRQTKKGATQGQGPGVDPQGAETKTPPEDA